MYYGVNMINEKNIAETISTVSKVAESIIENMEVGSRFTTKDFVDQIVEETHVPVSVAAGITALIVNNCDSVKPRAGRGGGIFKIDPKIDSAKNIAAIASAVDMDAEEDEDNNE
jgi:hypothetical protein